MANGSPTGHIDAQAAAAATTPLQRVVVLRQFGGPEGFACVDAPLPSAGRGEVRIRVLAASVQFTDVLQRTGKYPGTPAPPLVLGYDVVGVIDQLGAEVTNLQIGDRVADLTVTGSYARYRTLRADRVVRAPPNVDPAEATALVLSWTTAYQLLHRIAEVRPRQRVLVVGAAGAVGQALLGLGALAGLQMVGATRPAHFDRIRCLGAKPIDLANAQNIDAQGFDAVFDGIGEHGFAGSWMRVKRGGRLVAFGFASPAQSGAGSLQLAYWLARLQVWNTLPNGKAARFYSITAVRKRHPDWYRADLEALFQLLAEQRIRPRIAARIGLEAVADAHRRLAEGGLDGKIVICP